MRLVSDFDGVWTRPEAESLSQGEVLAARLAEWAPVEVRAQLPEWLAAARTRVAAAPTRFGWAPGGRLSAFGDEDPFTAHSALLHLVHLEAGTDPIAAALAGAVEAHGTTLERLGSWSHAEGVARVVALRGPAILPEAAAAGHALLDRGVEVAVVSNSGPDKLATWFAHAGLPTVRHPDRAPGVLRLRGDSRKFALDPDRSDLLELGDVRVETARPRYEEVLREERPHAVVGDVFSLDLSLPLVLRRREPEFRELRLLWLIHAYTPAWLRERVARYAPEVEPIEGGLGEMAERLARG